MSREDEIVEATIDMVAENGLMNFSSKDVVRKVGCSPSLLYRYFETNDALFKRCGQKIKERRVEITRDVINSVNRNDTIENITIEGFKRYIMRAIEKPNYCRFYYALVGTKYNNVTTDIDERSSDPFFHALSVMLGKEPDEMSVDTIVAFDCTRKAINQVVRAIANGIVPGTEEHCRRLAEMLTRGIGSFVTMDE